VAQVYEHVFIEVTQWNKEHYSTRRHSKNVERRWFVRVSSEADPWVIEDNDGEDGYEFEARARQLIQARLTELGQAGWRIVQYVPRWSVVSGPAEWPMGTYLLSRP
jgi:hypothetical protein